MIRAILIFFAAMFSAVMSKTKTEIAWKSSIFFGWKPSARFWCDEYPTPLLYPTKYKVNAWHLSQSLMYLCFLMAIFFQGEIMSGQLNCYFFAIKYDFIILSADLILSFNFFYNVVLHENK